MSEIEQPMRSGANMTPDEISAELIENTPDAFAAACNQIAALRDSNHKLIGNTGQLVMLNKHLLPMIDELREFVLTYAPMEAVNKLDCIREFVKAGSKF